MNDWLIRGYSGSITSSKKVWGCFLVWRVSVIYNIAPSLCPNKENVFRNFADNCQYYLLRLAKGYFLSYNIYGTRDIFHLPCFWNIFVILIFVYVVYMWALHSKTIKNKKKDQWAPTSSLLSSSSLKGYSRGERVLRGGILEGRQD